MRLREGSSIAREILVKAGTDGKSIVVSNGRVVDEGLQTEVDNLFVCDASVFPTSPGMPPILTIVALAKRLAKTLAP